MQKSNFVFDSTNGVNQIQYFVWEPEGQPKAMIQFVHGMAEHIERYNLYFKYLTDQGFLVFGDNHLGHKGSVRNDEELGYFAEKDGWKCLVEDEYKLTGIMKERYPDLPLFIYGHSMGSFITRTYCAWYPDAVKGAVISGTAGSNKALSAGRAFTKFIKKWKGDHHKSGMITALMFGSYNSKYKDVKDPYDWLTRDSLQVELYNEDPYCGFMFTTSGYLDLISLLDYVNSEEWYQKLPKDLPMFFISGTMDPVGGWATGLIEINGRLKEKGMTDYTMKLYDDMRHELHNEIGKEEVYQDVADWLNSHIQ